MEKNGRTSRFLWDFYGIFKPHPGKIRETSCGNSGVHHWEPEMRRPKTDHAMFTSRQNLVHLADFSYPFIIFIENVAKMFP